MSPLPALPARLAQGFQQLIVGAFEDPEVCESNVLMDDLAQAIRNCVAEALSSELARWNADLNRKGSRVLMSDDVLALILEQMPLEDVFIASRVCGKWRDVALSCPRLWTQLHARATTVPKHTVVAPHRCAEFSDSNDGEEDQVVVASNLRLLTKLLPRSQTQPLTLAVDATASIAGDFGSRLKRFLELAAPRLSVLRIATACTDVVLDVFYNSSWDFPLLRELVCSAAAVRYNCPVDFTGVHCPNLAHLDLGAAFQLAGLQDQPRLAFLRTRLDRLERIAPILHATPALTRVAFSLSIYEFGAVGTQRAEVHAAINAVDDVCFRTQHHAARVDGVLQFVQTLACARIVLELTDCERAFCPVLSGPWAAATQLALRASPDAVEIVFTAAARRTFTVRLLRKATCGAGYTQCIDWERVPVLGALTALRVDASLCCVAMRNFPRAPLLADTTLVVDGRYEVMVDGVEGLEMQSMLLASGGGPRPPSIAPSWIVRLSACPERAH